MSKAFRWIFLTMAMLALSSCRAFPTAPTILAPEQPETFYIHDGKLMRHPLGQEPQALLTLPDMGAVRDALKVDNTVFVLRERGLQRISLLDKNVDLIAQFPHSVVNGVLLAAANHEMLVFAVDERVEIYNLSRQTTSEVLSQPGSGFFNPLGLTADGEKLYLVPWAGDPEFPEVLVVNLSNGEIEPFSIGIGYQAALSPNGRYLAIASTRFITPEKPLEYGLTIFDLSSSQPSGRILSLPNFPSYADGLIWSSDSQRIYFLLRSGTPYEEPSTSYGLWGFDVETNTFFQVVAVDNPTMHLACISPDGEWILLMPEVENSIDLVHISTRKIETILLPTGPIVLVRW